ncbi:hypothetical protein LCGC14_0386980 [marine sediment metagenome]|uniref:Ribbon-helix-helix protein CopG domain-containing protein n=1 Tax=marine sediment metagenome TaxID=412755 RepID=A0A0F9T0R1_9ZZZZ
MEVPEKVLFSLTKQDKQMLKEIAAFDGDASMSAMLRKLIRAEWRRRQPQPSQQAAHNHNGDTE